MARSVTLFIVLIALCGGLVNAANDKKANHDEKWKKKSILDYDDADLNRLYEQWEEDEEPLEPDELPEHKRTPPKIDLSKLDPKDPESMIKASKSGRTLMMFATISGNPTRKETETISQLWQTSLFNAHYEVNRSVVGDNKVLFILSDGGSAWSVKDFLVKQERCEKVTIDNQDYPGLAVKPTKPASEFKNKKSDGVKITNVRGAKLPSQFRQEL